MLLFRVFLALYYVKLQNAFVTETNKVGDYSMIGYEMKSTTNFDYTEPTLSGKTNGTIAIPSSATLSWKAKANVALNDCDQNSEWGLYVKASTGTGVDYEGGIKDGGTVAAGTFDQACLALTASFKTISVDN